MPTLYPNEHHQSLRLRLAWGLRWGLYYGVALTVLGTLGYLIRPAAFQSNGIIYLDIVVLYLLGCPLAALLAGFFRPIAHTRSGSMFLGVIAGLPLSFAITVIVAGVPWTTDHTILLIVLVLASAVYGLAFRERFWLRGP